MATLFPDCTQSSPPETPPPLLPSPEKSPAQAFLQDPLIELQAIDCWLAQLDQVLRQNIDECLTGRRPFDVFTGVVLIRLWQDIHRLEAQTNDLVLQSRARIKQAGIGYQCLYGKPAEHR